MKLLMIITFKILCLLSHTFGYGTIPIELKGNTLSVEEYQKLDLCESKWCLEDANRILEDMSYNKSVTPCADFDEFTCGTFHQNRAHNERYEYVGYKKNYEKQIDEQLEKMLKFPIKDKEVKAVKLAKNFYQKCVNSTYIEKQSRQEFLEYVASFGKFPQHSVLSEFASLSNWSDWSETDFNFTKLQTQTKLEYFIDFVIELCPSPINANVKVLCLQYKKSNNKYSWFQFRVVRRIWERNDVGKMFEVLGYQIDPYFDFQIEEESSEYYYASNFPNEQKFESKNSPHFVKIKDMASKFGKLQHAEWIDVFKNQLPESFQLEETDEILISEDYKLASGVWVANKVDKRLLAHVVLRYIVTDFRPYYDVYPFGADEYNTVIKTPERFEICNNLFSGLMPITVSAMFSRQYFTKDAKQALHSLMQIALDDMGLIDLDKIEGLTFAQTSILAIRSNSIQIIAGFPNNMIEDSFLDRLYGKLNLDASETLLKSVIAMDHYKSFIKMGLTEEDITVFDLDSATRSKCQLIDFKYLYCPSAAAQYPNFHKDRSQFYNMATMLPDIYEALVEYPDSDSASRSYKKWMTLHGPERNLPGFLLTNQEMFWLALRNKLCEKGKFGELHSLQPNVKKVEDYYIRLWYPPPAFFDTFNCTESDKEIIKDKWNRRHKEKNEEDVVEND